MSLTKRQMEKDVERKRRDEKKVCGCKMNWEDKFEILCPKHFAEAENEAWHYLHELY